MAGNKEWPTLCSDDLLFVKYSTWHCHMVLREYPDFPIIGHFFLHTDAKKHYFNWSYLELEFSCFSKTGGRATDWIALKQTSWTKKPIGRHPVGCLGCLGLPYRVTLILIFELEILISFLAVELTLERLTWLLFLLSKINFLVPLYHADFVKMMKELNHGDVRVARFCLWFLCEVMSLRS